MNGRSWIRLGAGIATFLLSLFVFLASVVAETGYVTASALYARSQPLLDAKILHTYKQNEKVEIIGESSNKKWYKIQYGNQSAYVWKEYVSVKSSSSSDEYTDADGGHHGSYRTASSKPTASSLQKGDKGDDVKKLQTALKTLNYFSGSIDGKFGSSTKKAVERYQQAIGLTVDGIAGKKTLKKLFSVGASGGKLKTENLEWFKDDNDEIIPKGAYFYIKDVKTGEVLRCKRWSGAYHMDVEPATEEDTAILSKIYGGSWSWSRRAILVLYKGHVYAASMNGMPHGHQTITNNQFNGQFCIHFDGSTTHGTLRVDKRHQQCVQTALGYSW